MPGISVCPARGDTQSGIIPLDAEVLAVSHKIRTTFYFLVIIA